MYGSYTRALMERARAAAQAEISRKKGCAAGMELAKQDQAAGIRRTRDDVYKHVTFNPCGTDYAEGFWYGYTLIMEAP